MLSRNLGVTIRAMVDPQKPKGLVFVSGPYSGSTAEDTQANIAKAHEVSRKLTAMGWVVVCPNTQLSPLADLQGYEFWLEAALNLLDVCKYVVHVPGWEKSSGVKVERLRAVERGILIFETPEELEGYYNT